MQSISRQSTARHEGFAMLFTVLIVSIILSIAIGISNVTFKQNLLSSIAKDSQVAFFAADSGVECGLYYDLQANYFPRGVGPGVQGVDSEYIGMHTFTCGDMTFNSDVPNSDTSYIVFKEVVSDQTKPCRTIVFDKTDPVINKVQSRGYSVCQSSPRQVERALEARY